MIELPQTLLEVTLGHQEIKDRQQKFIIFVDDLSFADNEERYTALRPFWKAVWKAGRKMW